MIPTLDPRVISYIQKYLLVNKEPWEFYKEQNHDKLLSEYIKLKEKIKVASEYILKIHQDNLILMTENEQLKKELNYD